MILPTGLNNATLSEGGGGDAAVLALLVDIQTGVLAIPTNPVLDNDSRLDDYATKADVYGAAMIRGGI